MINFSGLSEYLKSKKIKVGLMAEGPDELLGGYKTDIEAYRIDKIFSKKDKINFASSMNKLNLIKNKDFKIQYKPFKTRVTHFSENDKFLKLIINELDKKIKLNSFNDVSFRTPKKYSSLSYSQLRALNYINKSIPEMINMRKDKSMMMNSIEPRFPFLSKNIVEFLISMPDKYRFQKGFGKFFLRKYSEKYISSSVAWFPKKGMGHYAWDNFKGFFNELKARKVIKKSKLFSKNLFKKFAKFIIFNKNVHKAN